MNNFLSNNFSIVNLYKNKSLKSEVVTQMIYGERFSVINKSSKWLKIKLKEDNYVGYIIKKKNFYILNLRIKCLYYLLKYIKTQILKV